MYASNFLHKGKWATAFPYKGFITLAMETFFVLPPFIKIHVAN